MLVLLKFALFKVSIIFKMLVLFFIASNKKDFGAPYHCMCFLVIWQIYIKALCYWTHLEMYLQDCKLTARIPLSSSNVTRKIEFYSLYEFFQFGLKHENLENLSAVFIIFVQCRHWGVSRTLSKTKMGRFGESS